MAKRGIALPAIHGLRTAIERHKGRLQAELTKARIRRKLSSIEALKAHVETGAEHATDGGEMLYPRWVRINTLKTTVEEQLESTFKGYERVQSVGAVRKRGGKRVFVDGHVPNLLAVSQNVEVMKSEAYKNGEVIFQDKASCFPAYMLDVGREDGDVIDSCAAPGNKTTHVAAILRQRIREEEVKQMVHAFEKNKGRAETLEKMVGVAGSDGWTKLYPGQDFLKTDPMASTFKKVGALLLDPSCSGSGIVGRDEIPELCLPAIKQHPDVTAPFKKGVKTPDPRKEVRKRKREDKQDLMDVMVDDDGVVTAVNTDDELKARLVALSKFQLELLLHAMKFPAAKKITYSTCSVHAEENEMVVLKALESQVAKEQGWRIMKRKEQVKGMREWTVRGDKDACNGDGVIAESCIRANKGDEHGTMGFFLAGFVRDGSGVDVSQALEAEDTKEDTAMAVEAGEDVPEEIEEEWGGIGEDEMPVQEFEAKAVAPQKKKPAAPAVNKHSFGAGVRTGLVPQNKKRRKGKAT